MWYVTRMTYDATLSYPNDLAISSEWPLQYVTRKKYDSIPPYAIRNSS